MPRARAVALPELEPNQDDRALHREWRFERVGWGVIALMLAAGFAGLFGDGALASASVVSADGGAVLHYERIIRRGAQSDIELRLAPAARADTIVVVSLDDEYLTAVDVDRVTPEPLGVRASSERVEYHLRRLDGRRSAPAMARSSSSSSSHPETPSTPSLSCRRSYAPPPSTSSCS